MLVRELRHKPAEWREHRKSVRSRWALPFHAFEWSLQWTAQVLGHWAFLEVLGIPGQPADLSKANLRGIIWHNLKAVDPVNIYGVRNAPTGFVVWAMQHGAQSRAGEEP
jgi:hypothetical protein